jgi:predicted transcriptional regulator of viral defense system
MNTDIQDIFEKNNGFLKAKDLTFRNQWNQLTRLIDSGVAVKLKRGLYCMQQHSMIDQNMEVAQIVPSGVFCLFSAWQHYHLTTNNPFEYHVAINREDKIVLPEYPPIKIYRWSEKFYTLGIVEIEQIKIYDIEKSVCDAVRFRNKVGMDIAIEVVKSYVRRKDRNFDKLTKYARQLRIETIIQNMIMPML